MGARRISPLSITRSPSISHVSRQFLCEKTTMARSIAWPDSVFWFGKRPKRTSLPTSFPRDQVSEDERKKCENEVIIRCFHELRIESGSSHSRNEDRGFCLPADTFVRGYFLQFDRERVPRKLFRRGSGSETKGVLQVPNKAPEAKCQCSTIGFDECPSRTVCYSG